MDLQNTRICEGFQCDRICVFDEECPYHLVRSILLYRCKSPVFGAMLLVDTWCQLGHLGVMNDILSPMVAN